MSRRFPFFFLTATVALILLLLEAQVSIRTCNGVTLLEEALLNDMFPSSMCDDINATSFTFNFTPSPSVWSSKTAPYEPLVFLAEMHHDDENPNRTWTLRLGTGGQVYSFRGGSYGEAMPPQANQNAAWMDTVLQMVAVNLDRNDPPENDLYYIHQAGTYMTDESFGVPPPFYSPTLAMRCGDSHCDVASWGQQAHIPSIHRSDVIYYARYQDCGEGVLEVTQVIHNAASDPTDALTYLNVPWTGLRHSTFHDVMLTDVNGSLHREFPMQLFGQDKNLIPDLKDTGGFTTFAQGLAPPENAAFQVPCVDGNGLTANCDANGAEPIRLVVARNDSAQSIAGLSSRFGYAIVRMHLLDFEPYRPTIEGCRKWCGSVDGLLFVNNRTGVAIQVKDVVHWLWHGRFLYFAPNMTAAEINSQFSKDDGIEVRFGVGGMEFDDSMALTFVHGVDPESSDPSNTWLLRHSRLRYGGVLAVERDALVYTVNVFGNVESGSSYVNRQFIVTGELSGMEERAKAIVPKTQQLMRKPEDHGRGRKLTLRSTNTSFTLVVGNETCPEGTVKCIGSSVPSHQLSPLFFITCDNLSYVGPDQYHFAPPRESHADPFRPYVCHGSIPSARPSWQLLGYFRRNHCNVPVGLRYEPPGNWC